MINLTALQSLTPPALVLLAPEILLAAMAMLVLTFGVFRPKSMRSVYRITALTLILAIVALLLPLRLPLIDFTLFNGAIVMDDFARYMKCLILVAALAAIFMARDYLERTQLQRFEYPVLILLATLGMCLMVSARDLISMYLALELQGLCLYVLAAFKRDSLRSSEAGLKYFVLGALSSGILLFGCSLLYGFSGATGFEDLAGAAGTMPENLGLLFGLVFVLAGLAFKCSAVPFHMWTPDVYEGAPTPVTAFLAGAAKLAAVALIVRFLADGFLPAATQWQQIIIALAVASMVLGAFAAIGQKNIKRLMAYSAIGHIGYMLAALVTATFEGVAGILLYLALYLIMNIGIFTAVLMMQKQDSQVENISELAGLHERNPLLAFMLAILLFSLAGVPPLAGFFAKFYVFLAVVEAGLYPLAVIGVLASVVAAFYYLRIVKIMYFDAPAEPIQQASGFGLKILLVAAGVINLAFFVYPAALLIPSQLGAASLIAP